MKIVYRLITISVGVVFVYSILNFFLQTEEISILPYLEQISPLKLALSSLAYLFSHFLRSLRVALMMGRQDFSLVNLIGKQYYTNGINLILPFKLGEVYRIVEFNKIFRDPERTFLTVIAERTIDFLFLFVGLFVALYFTKYSIFDLSLTVFIGGLFILGVLFIYYVLPENIRWLNLFLVKRYTKRWVVRVLAITSRAYSVIMNIKQIIRRRVSTIVMLTSLIWLSEIAGLLFIIDYLPQIEYFFLLAFFVFLSSLIPSGSLGLGALQFAFYLIYLVNNSFPYFSLSMIYQFFIFLPAIFIGFAVYIVDRLRQWRSVKNAA